MNAIGIRIKELRKEKKLTQKELSEILCVTQSSISRYESCTGEPDSAFFASFSKSFPDVNMHWLLTGSGPMYQELIPLDAGMLEDTIRLPISAEIAAGEPCEVVLDEPLGYLDLPKSLLHMPPPYLVFQVKGRSMEPHILNGDLVVCSRVWKGIRLDGKIFAFRTPDGITLKTLKLDTQNKITWLMPINHEFTPVPYYKDSESFAMIGILDISIRRHNI